MKIVNNNIETLPLDIIGMLMKRLLAGGFEDCFNFFLAWAQTQRPAVILSFLDGIPLREMYKFASVGSAAHKACFECFFGIAENLGVHDAILYKRCRDILCGLGDIDGHLTVVDDLARAGHFTSMVGSFALRNIYKKESIAHSLHSLVGIFEHREFKDGIIPALVNLESIYSANGYSVIGVESSVGAVCHIHSGSKETLTQNEFMGVFDCFFCAVRLLLKVFSKKGANLWSCTGC